MSNNLRTYIKALYGFDATMARTAADVWSNQSPCAEWTAADVVAHSIGMNQMIAGFTTGVPARGARHELPQDPQAEWGASLDGLLEALDQPGALQSVAKTPWGELAVDKFLGFAWVDPVIHTWDLAKATGQTPALDATLVAIGTKQLERAGDSLVGEGRFHAAVPTSSDDAIERLIALTGRDPSF